MCPCGQAAGGTGIRPARADGQALGRTGERNDRAAGASFVTLSLGNRYAATPACAIRDLRRHRKTAQLEQQFPHAEAFF